MATFYSALFGSEKLVPFNARDGMFDPREPVALAGSDLVNFFLYERSPRDGLELFIASTHAAAKAPMVRDQIASLAGFLRMGERETNEPELARATGKPVSEAVSSLIDQFVAALNSGEKATISKFVSDHFVLTADGPTPDQRAERLSGLHGDLGSLTVVRKTAVDQGPVQVIVKAEREPEAMLTFDIDPASNKIRRFGIQVGG
jgi:hypothetical protein